jgi:hypothetical protein
MPSTVKQAKTTALESICTIPITRVHGRPTHRNYKTLMEEASTLANKVEDIIYAWSKNATDNYGLLTNILGTDEYDELTVIDSHAIPCKPASYNPTITNAILTHECKWKEVEWDLIRTTWFIRGSSRGSLTSYTTPSTNNTTPSSSISELCITTSPLIKSSNTSMTNGAPSTFKQRRC